MNVFRRVVVASGVLAGLVVPAVVLATPAQALPSCTTASAVDGPGLSYWFWPTTENGDANCVMGRGNQSLGVRRLQINLNQCYGQGLVDDGIYGPATERAVRNVQAAIGARVDGVYGPETRSKMRWYTYATSSAPCQVHY